MFILALLATIYAMVTAASSLTTGALGFDLSRSHATMRRLRIKRRLSRTF